ncbi:MAG: hypothetical protein CXT77_01005 [uncultured DHVE6 group euryarchaeote]|nr:MAG: hypothetical protein CXT77_01005 [uncultured DHVE6 group euryarchaeote]
MFSLFGFLMHLFIFASVQILGILTGIAAINKLEAIDVVATETSLIGAFFSFAIAFTLLFFIFRYSRKVNLFKYFFYLLIIIGSKVVFETYFTNLIANIFTIGLLALFIFSRSIITHNLALIITIAGVGVTLGLSFSFSTVFLLIGLFSIYDILAVYRSSHMVNMFKGMVKKGVILAVIIPNTLKKVKAKSTDFEPGKGLLILGTGDLAFPLLLAISALKFSVMSAWFISGGAVIGAGVVYYLLNTQKSTRAMPALPPIALFSVLGFIVSLMI